MLDQLPLELIQLIVHLTLPTRDSPLTYRKRQDTLLALCKTSRVVLKVAQPVLFEVVELKEEERVERFIEVVKDETCGRRVQDVRITTDMDRWLELEADLLKQLSVCCPNVSILRLTNVKFEVQSLEVFTNLRRLVTVNSHLRTPRPFRLATLEELSLVCTHFDHDELLMPSSYPRLKALHVHLSEHPALDPRILNNLVRQVDCVSLDSADVEKPIDCAASFLSRTLFDYSLDRLALVTAEADSDYKLCRNIRLSPVAGDESIDPNMSFEQICAIWLSPSELDRLALELRRAVTVPATLYLPSILQDPTDTSTLSLPQALHSLLRACTDRAIEVVFESRPDSLCDSFVSPSFWRHCKAPKAKEDADKEKEAEGEGGEGGKKEVACSAEVGKAGSRW